MKISFNFLNLHPLKRQCAPNLKGPVHSIFALVKVLEALISSKINSARMGHSQPKHLKQPIFKVLVPLIYSVSLQNYSRKVRY